MNIESTALVLNYIAEAIQHPNEEVNLKSEHLYFCAKVIHKLELEGFTLNKRKNTLKCSVRKITVEKDNDT